MNTAVQKKMEFHEHPETGIYNRLTRVLFEHELSNYNPSNVSNHNW